MSAHFGNAFLELGETAGTGGASAGNDGTSVTLSAASPEVSALEVSCGGSDTILCSCMSCCLHVPIFSFVVFMMKLSVLACWSCS